MHIWYLVKSDLSSVRHCSFVHWTSNFLQGTRTTRPCITDHRVPDEWQLGHVAAGPVLVALLLDPLELVPMLLQHRRLHLHHIRGWVCVQELGVRFFRWGRGTWIKIYKSIKKISFENVYKLLKEFLNFLKHF